jgi:hypothetical protein
MLQATRSGCRLSYLDNRSPQKPPGQPRRWLRCSPWSSSAGSPPSSRDRACTASVSWRSGAECAPACGGRRAGPGATSYAGSPSSRATGRIRGALSLAGSLALGHAYRPNLRDLSLVLFAMRERDAHHRLPYRYGFRDPHSRPRRRAHQTSRVLTRAGSSGLGGGR